MSQTSKVPLVNLKYCDISNNSTINQGKENKACFLSPKKYIPIKNEIIQQAAGILYLKTYGIFLQETQQGRDRNILKNFRICV